MKKNSLSKTIWITALFLTLIIILISVMDYKIHYQYKTKKNLYFYDCSGTLCVTEVENNGHLLYSKYECNYDNCPIFKSQLSDTYAILKSHENADNILFDYRKNEIISSDYEEYQLLGSNYIIITKNKEQGIINLENKIIIPPSYEQLGYNQDGYLTGYGVNYIIAKKNNKYGIISLKDEGVIEDFNYEEKDIDNLLQLLNDKEKLLQSN